MLIDRIYDELYKVAEHQGPLDEEAVRTATTILALPRYAASKPSPASRLVEDLKRIIATIPADTKSEDDAEDPWATRYFQSYARRFFSLDAAGEAISRRRSFTEVEGLSGQVRKNVKGTAIAWMNRGVIYRMAAGLLELWSETSSSEARQDAAGSVQGYRIEAVSVRSVSCPGVPPCRKLLEYDLRILALGPHLLVLPRSFASDIDTLKVINNPSLPEQSAPPIVSLDALRKQAVIFGEQDEVGALVHLQIERRVMSNDFMGPIGECTVRGGAASGSTATRT